MRASSAECDDSLRNRRCEGGNTNLARIRALPATVVLVFVVYALVAVHGPILSRDDRSLLTPA